MVWKQLQGEAVPVARCTVVRLMRELGLHGEVRGRRIRTTIPDAIAARPQHVVPRNFSEMRPTHLWVADLTYVATWPGFASVAFVVGFFSRRIVSWRISSSFRRDLALDALEQALYDRGTGPERVHCNNAGCRIFQFGTPSGWPRSASSRPGEAGGLV